MTQKTKSVEKVKRGAILFLVVAIFVASIFFILKEEPNITGLAVLDTNNTISANQNTQNQNTQTTPPKTQTQNTQETNTNSNNVQDSSKDSSVDTIVGYGSKKPSPKVPISKNFSKGQTTEWEKEEDLSEVCNAIIDVPGLGRIKWLECVDAEYANLDNFIKIEKGVIFVDSSKLHPSFNSAAELKMGGLDYQYTPVVYRDGELCETCKVTGYSNGQLTFNVQGFSSYTFGPNTELTIWDETDPSSYPFAGLTKYPGENVKFFAEYDNVTSGNPIPSATCHINFTDSSATMSYNSSEGFYEYTRSFSGSTAYDYNVTCQASGYETLQTNDLSSINTPTSELGNPGPRGANLTEISSSRGQTTSPENHSSTAGNVTSLTINGDSITQGWQGYYGNVSGSIELSNSQGNVFYNWSVNSPTGEVYASRSAGVNFGNISCAPVNHITNEENNLGQDSSDTDSISNTFSSNNHPEFYVGEKQFLQDDCSSINLYVNSVSQSTEFYEVLLSDNSANIVYTAILEQDVSGFDNAPHDFEMIVGEDGHGSDQAVTPYYFYLEIQ